jgi:predicted nucleotidyltransferase
VAGRTAERPAIIELMTDDGHARRRLVQEQRARIVDFLAARGVRNVRLFGSLARGEDDPDSDIDLLVELEGDPSPGMELMTVLGLSEELSELLATRVDVVTIRALRPELREVALAEAVPL